MTVLVTAYASPDLDGLAGCVAYAEFLKHQGRDVVAGVIGTPHDEARFVLDYFKLECPMLLENGFAYADAILVDASDVNGLAGLLKPEQVIEIIDHRTIHEAHKFPRATAQIELVGAAATLVAEKFMAANTPITQRSAILLQSAIISNTLNLKGTITTDRDRAAIAWLQPHSQLPADFWRAQFTAKSDVSGDKLKQRMQSEFAQFEFNGIKIGVFQLEVMDAASIITARSTEILAGMAAQKAALGLDHVFQNTIDIADSYNLLITDHAATQALLSKALGVSFIGSAARHTPALFRKQIMPPIRQQLG